MAQDVSVAILQQRREAKRDISFNNEIKHKSKWNRKQRLPSPQWVEDMQKWYKENKKQRAVFCVTSSEESLGGLLFGCSLPILAALVELMEKDDGYKDLISSAATVLYNPIGSTLLRAKWEEYKKEHGIKNHDESEPSDISSIKSTLKDFYRH